MRQLLVNLFLMGQFSLKQCTTLHVLVQHTTSSHKVQLCSSSSSMPERIGCTAVTAGSTKAEGKEDQTRQGTPARSKKQGPPRDHCALSSDRLKAARNARLKHKNM